MSIPKPALPFFDPPRGPFVGAASRLAAASLTAASAVLSRLAVRLLEPRVPVPAALPRLEFHVDADALGGALYLDGEWVGRLPRVTRL